MELADNTNRSHTQDVALKKKKKQRICLVLPHVISTPLKLLQ